MTQVQAVIGTEGGVDDATFLRRMRELLNDMPKVADEQWNGTGTATRFQSTLVPINDDEYVAVTVGGVAQTIVTSRSSISAGQVWIDFDTGFFIFGTAPGAGTNNVVVLKSRVKWRDGVLLNALYGGLRAAFPMVWRSYVDTSVVLAVNQWDYPLPPVFNDPRIKLFSVSVREVPAATNRFIPITGAYRVGFTTLQIPRSQRWTPGSVVRLEYMGPYQSLADLEPQAFDLPIWYAAGVLLGFREEKRARMDTQNITADVSANPPGAQQNAGAWFMRQYYQLLSQLKRPMRTGRVLTSYQL